MGTTAQKLLRVAMSKADIGNAIVDKGRGIAPPYDAEIEYLETTETGTFCIRSGVMMTKYREFDSTFSHIRRVSGESGWKALIGTRYDTTRAMFYISPNATLASVSINFDYGSSTQGAVVSGISTTNPLRIGIRRTGSYATGYVGDKIKNAAAIDFPETTDDIISLLPNYDKIMFRCYGFYILDFDGTLLFDGIPVRVGQTGYLYDRANPYGGPNGNGLYGNLGTGSFVLGPDVKIPSKRVMPKKFSQWGDEIRTLQKREVDFSDWDNNFLCFWDLDGNFLYSFSKDEVASWTSLNDLPPPPQHPEYPTYFKNPIWNWSWEHIQAALTNNSPGHVGPQYSTGDDWSVVIVDVPADKLEIGFATGDKTGQLNFGDGSETVSYAANAIVRHTYSNPGRYFIKCLPSANFGTIGTNSRTTICSPSGGSADDLNYNTMIHEIFFGIMARALNYTYGYADNCVRVHFSADCVAAIDGSNSMRALGGNGNATRCGANQVRAHVAPIKWVDYGGNFASPFPTGLKIICAHPNFPWFIYGSVGANVGETANSLVDVRFPSTFVANTDASQGYVSTGSIMKCPCQSIYLGMSSNTIGGNNVFQNCCNLKKIYVGHPKNNNLIPQNYLNTCYNLKEILGINLKKITTLQNGPFQNCKKLFGDGLEMPKLTSIGTSAFNGCTIMQWFLFGEAGRSMTIGNSSCSSCTFLKKAIFNGNVTSIGTQAFQNDISLVSILFNENTQVPTLANVNAFASTSALAEIVVPDSLYDDWKAATNWSSTTNGIVNKITKASVYGGYTSRVEYLESTGDQWIDTGVSADNLTGFEMTCTPFGAAGEKMGAASSGAGGPACGVVQTDEGFSISLKADDSVVSNDEILPGGTDSFVVSYDAEYGIGQVGDVSSDVDKSYLDEWATDNTFYLFAQNRGEASSFCHTRLYGAKIFYNDKLIHDYIPVRVDATGCLYDRMTNDLVYNQGIEDFIVGPDV